MAKTRTIEEIFKILCTKKKEEIKYPFVLAFNDLLYTLRINSREGRRTEKRGGGAKRIRTPNQGVWSSTSGNSYRTSKNRYVLQ